MLDRKFLVALLLSCATLFIFNYFRGKPELNQEQVAGSGKFYTVMSQEELNLQQKQAQLVRREVDFLDADTPGKKPEEITTITTSSYIVKLSNYGGGIASVSYPRRPGALNIPLTTITPKDFDHKDQSAFLLALTEKTPYFYDLERVEKVGDNHLVAYRVLTHNGWQLRKIFTIADNRYEIGIRIEATPLNGAFTPLELRLFVPSPIVAATDTQSISAYIAGLHDRSVKVVDAQDMNRATVLPAIFGTQSKYFAHGLVRDANKFAQMAYFSEVNGVISSIYASKVVSAETAWDLSFYIGPKDIQDLALVDSRLESLLNFGMFSWLCKLLLMFLAFLYSFLGNYGFAIIALTLIIKIPLLPLSLKAAAAQEQQKRYAPHLARIRQQYKHDSQRMVIEMQRFYQEHNASPMGAILGALPMLIDFPIMLALYSALGNYIDLYHAPFMLWIQDLSAPDPYYVLPFLMGVSQLAVIRLTPVADEKMRVVGLFMALVFMVISANLASGLVLYWLIKNLITFGEYFLRRNVA